MIVVWRHPRPQDAQGRCIGHTDLPVDRRRAKRLAHRIRAYARRERCARLVWTSPLERGRAVGRWLRAFGFEHRIADELAELRFGAWDGKHWSEIAAAEFAAWQDDFLHHAPGGDGESLAQLLERVQRFGAICKGSALVVGHAGWINAWRWLQLRPQQAPRARDWPLPVRYGERVGAATVLGS